MIVLTAGMKNADAGGIVSALLRKDNDLATFLAAQCLETAIELPLKTRNRVEKRLEAMVPPKSSADADRLRALGLAAAPVLTKALLGVQKPDEKVWLIQAIRDTDYEPAISALGRVASDHREVGAIFSSTALRLAVDQFALFALADLAESSELAARAFAQAVEHASDHAIERMGAYLRHRSTDTARRLLELLPDRAKEARPGKSPSKGS